MADIETVKVKWPANKRAGYAIINMSDFNPDKHELFEEKAKPASTQGGKPDDPTPPKPAAEILKMLEDPQVHYSTARAEAEKLLGDANTPAKKVDLVEALKARAAA